MIYLLVVIFQLLNLTGITGLVYMNKSSRDTYCNLRTRTYIPLCVFRGSQRWKICRYMAMDTLKESGDCQLLVGECEI